MCIRDRHNGFLRLSLSLIIQVYMYLIYTGVCVQIQRAILILFVQLHAVFQFNFNFWSSVPQKLYSIQSVFTTMSNRGSYLLLVLLLMSYLLCMTLLISPLFILISSWDTAKSRCQVPHCRKHFLKINYTDNFYVLQSCTMCRDINQEMYY